MGGPTWAETQNGIDTFVFIGMYIYARFCLNQIIRSKSVHGRPSGRMGQVTTHLA